MKKFATLILWMALAIAPRFASAQKCGNDCPGGPASCDKCPKQGANPFSPYSGSVQRYITDLEMFGGVGEEKLSFGRLTTSRYKPGIPTPFGTGGSWRHSYYWNIVPAGTDAATGTEIIHIDYPGGTEHDFHKETTSSLYLTAVSSTQERVEQSSTDSSQYYLWFPDGKHISFRKVGSGSTATFQVQGFYDKYNNFYSFTLDTKNRVTRVTEPGGRYIQLNYGSIGNFNVVNANFSYTNTTATTVGVAGDFNGWHEDRNRMVQQNGVWKCTLPVQPQTSYQYKFVVNGSTWVSDPNNPTTAPAGGPSTGNNSVMSAITNGDLDTVASPVPVTFTYTSATATSVSVAGSFNGWNSGANLLTKTGSTWSTTISVSPGVWDYKFVVNGGSWVADPNNAFTDPDGYGGSNSRLVVGPLDEAITSVLSSDGRSVNYSYAMYTVGGSIYSILTRASYGDGTAAFYTWSTPTIGSRPTLESADDPRYKGPATRVAYIYQNNGIEGFISTESSLVDGTVLASLAPSDTGSRSVTTGGRQLQTLFAQGNVTSETDSLNRVKSYTYFNDGWGMLSGVTDFNGTTTYERTLQFGNVSKTTFPDGSTKQVTYSNSNKPFFPATMTDENGKQTVYTRDANNRPTRIDYPDGGYETFTYDPANLSLLASHRLTSGATESFTYYLAGDNGGRPGDIKTRTNGAGETATYTYDAAGRVASVTDGRSNTTFWQYNDRGQMTRVTFMDGKYQAYGYDTYGNRTSVTNELGKTWVSTYDQYNRLLTTADPLGNTTHYSYSLPQSGGCSSCSMENYPTSITLPSGKTTTIAYDTEWQKTSVTVGAGTADAATTSYTYDGVGNVQTVTDPRGKVWSYTYDNRNRRKRATDPNGNYTDWTYDGTGNMLTEKRSGDAVATVYAYDAMNRVTDITDQAGQNRHMTYDGAGNMLTLRDPRSNTYGFTYDGMNRKTGMTYPTGGGAEAWTYDAVGNMLTYTTRANQVCTYTYDNRNRQTQAGWANNAAPNVMRTYDDASRLLTLNNGVSSLSYAYDDSNRLLSETQQIASDSGPKTVSYTYDVDGNRATLGYPGGSSAAYGYTNRNQLNSISSSGITAAYTYDLGGNRLAKTLGNSASAAYTYDDAGRLMTFDNQKAGASLAKFDYAYDAVNNRTSRTETVDGTAKVDAYGYDAVDQVTQVKYNYNAGTGTQDRLVAYAYDPSGNRTGANGVTDSVNGNSNYTANALNQYTAAGVLVPTYDANGNMITQDGWTYAYDAQNRMTSATSAQSSVTFAYDGRNRCVSRTINGTVTWFYYDGWNLIEERGASDTVLARYVNGANVDEIIARVAGGVASYYHHDALGSTIALTDSTGTVVERYKYDVFGAPTILNTSNLTLNTSAFGNRFLFTGREYIQQAAIYDFRNRIYSPLFGRFLQIDPIRLDAGDVNLYRYVSNVVSALMDPLGLFSCDPWRTLRYFNYKSEDGPVGRRAKGDWLKDGGLMVLSGGAGNPPGFGNVLVTYVQHWMREVQDLVRRHSSATAEYQRTCTCDNGTTYNEKTTSYVDLGVEKVIKATYWIVKDTQCQSSVLYGPAGACTPDTPRASDIGL